MSMGKNSATIKREISRLFLVIGLVISITVMTLTLSTIKNTLKMHANEDLLAIAQLKVDDIENRLKNGRQVANHISSDTRLTKSASELALIAQHRSDAASELKAELIEIINTKLKASSSLKWANIYDANYNLIISTGENSINVDEFAYRVDALDNIKKPKIGTFYSVNNQIYHNIYIPLHNPENDFQIVGYVVVGRHCSCEFNNFEKFSIFGETGEFVIAQKQGNYIQIISHLRHKNNSIHNLISHAQSSDILMRAFSGIGGDINGDDYRNKSVIASYVYSQDYNISVIAKIDESAVFAEVELLFIKISAILFITLLLTYLFVSRRLERSLSPVIELERGAKKFALGELNYRIPILGNNELSRLTRIFNNMAEKLELVTASKDDLDRQVEKQKEVEQQLHAERAKLEAIFESNKDSIVVWDENYRHIYANHAAAKQVGLSKRSMLGKTISEIFADAPETSHFWVELVKQVFIDGEVIERSDEFEYKDKHFFAESTISPVLNEDKEIIAVGMVLRDVTERMHVEEAAHASWQMLHQVIDSIPVSVFWKDLDGKFLGANMNLVKSLGLDSPEELLGKTDYDICSKEFADDYRRDDLEVIESKQSKINYEEKFVDDDGNEITINTSKVPLVRGDGSVYGVLGCFVDVTERANFIDKLQEAQRNADLANKSKSDFLASMSHEVRTPINAIIGMADVLLQSGITSNQTEYVNILKSAGENLSHLVNNILDYTKIEAGKLELQNDEFSLGDSLNDTVHLVMLKTHEKNLYLNMHVDEEVQLKLYGDSGKLRQILLNLLNNAAKFTFTGGVDLKVSEWHHPVPGKYMLLFEVSDTGQGIPEDKIKTIFESFVRLEGEDKDNQSGAGLGLSICKELVSALGGEIWVESEEGQGSKFSFTAAFKPLDALQVLRHQAPGKLSLRGAIAKVCCNSPEMVEQMQQTLEEWNIKVRHTSEATQNCFEQESDFLILMPDESMLERIVNKYQKEDLQQVVDKVILIPQNLNMQQLQMLQSLGVRNVLQQPIVRKDLYEQLDAIYKLKKTSVEQRGGDNKFSWYDPARIHVMIADDDPITKKVMRLAFENMGYRIDIASNGEEVLEFLKQDTYDIIFMDTDMPEMDGNDTTKAIRELEKDSDTRIPIVAVTAKVFDEDRKRAFDSGIDWFLPKPTIVEQMVEAINKLVKF